MHDGEYDFKAGNYKDAFHRLLPVAVQGRPEAQYAVGYMYYYGYGIPQDNESGVFWMERAAAQNYAPAKTALEMIRQNDMLQLKAETVREQPDQRDEIMQSVNVQRNRAVAPIVVTPRHLQRTSEVVSENDKPRFSVGAVSPAESQVLAENNSMIDAETQPAPEDKKAPDTVVAEAKPAPQTMPEIEAPKKSETAQTVTNDRVVEPRNFALQLYGSYHLTDVKELQTQLKLKNTGHIYQTNYHGKDWYVLTFGNFQTVHEAAATKNNLPGGLKQMDPWVRKISSLKMV